MRDWFAHNVALVVLAVAGGLIEFFIYVFKGVTG